MFERFTVAARQTVIRARDEARILGHSHIGTEHLLLALSATPSGAPSTVLGDVGLNSDRLRAAIQRQTTTPRLTDEDAAALRTIGIDLEDVLARIEALAGPQPTLEGEGQRPGDRSRGWARRGARGRLAFTRRAKTVLEFSLREARSLGHNHLGTEHIFLGLLQVDDGMAIRILIEAGADPQELRTATLRALDQAA